MTLDADAVGGAIARGGNAAQQSQAGEYNPLDVWTHTGEGAGQQGATSSMDLSHVGSTPVGDVPGAMQMQAGDLGEALKAVKDADGALATTGAVFGALTSAEQLISIPFSAIPFPALPAVRILDFAIGLPHAHSHPPNLTPPNPVPIPLPSFGPVIPIPFLSGANSVLINGMPAGRCLDMGLGVWCGGYFPMFEIFLGSSSVWIEGLRAARIGVDITKHCVFSSFKVAPGDPPLGVPIGTTVTASPNVIIGGVPMPSLMAFAVGAALKGVFKGLGKAVGAAKRARAARAASRAEQPPAARPPQRALPAAERPALPAAPTRSWPRRTPEAYAAAQQVREAVRRVNARSRSRRTFVVDGAGEASVVRTELISPPGAAHVFTHADGSVSVGLSGDAGRAIARDVERELNAQGRHFAVDSSGNASVMPDPARGLSSQGQAPWRVSGEVDPDIPLGRHPRRMLDPRNCAEPRAASAARRSDSPITGSETIQLSEGKNNYKLPSAERHVSPETGKKVKDQMKPCRNCDLNKHEIVRHAHRGSSGE